MDQSQARLEPGPTSLSIVDAAVLLTEVGGQSISAAMIEADLAAGAPANADGTINLVYYAAWLVKETVHGN